MKISVSNLVIVGIMLTSLMSCQSDNDFYSDASEESLLERRLNELYGSTSVLIQPEATDFASIPNDINNPITQAKVELGKLLYHETGLAINAKNTDNMYTYSCASCHHVDAGFQSGIRQGIGDGGVGFGIHGEARTKNPLYLEQDLDVQPIRTPTALNVAYQEVMLWNGQFGAKGPNEGTESQWTEGTPKAENKLGFEGVETQAIAGLDVHRLVIDGQEIEASAYKALFDEAFPDSPEDDRYTKVNAGLAIAAYERTLLPNQSPFQKWLKGDQNAMSDDQVEGARLFFEKANCYSCHSGPALNDMKFHALGMNDLQGPEIMTVVDDATKRGRGGFTGNPDDDYKFKTPQLYNLKDVHFLGHGGTFTSVREVIEYKNKAISENSEVALSKLSPFFVPLDLSDTEIELLTIFIEEALYDNNLSRYVPESLPTGNCFPNADPQSSSDLGCD